MRQYIPISFWNLWPPFLFTGIKIQHASPDFRHLKIKLKLRFWNANYVGTQYGGSIFSMADPFYMLMLIRNLGKEYTVWDKSAHIAYLKPGKTDLFAEFNLTEDDLSGIKKILETQKSLLWNRRVEIKDANGIIIAEIEKEIYIRNKRGDKQ